MWKCTHNGQSFFTLINFSEKEVTLPLKIEGKIVLSTKSSAPFSLKDISSLKGLEGLTIKTSAI